MAEGTEDDHETMRIMPIGAGNEVGRSCVILKYMGKTIMLDCGIHPVRAHPNMNMPTVVAVPLIVLLEYYYGGPQLIGHVVFIKTYIFDHFY